jgi:hypothetical protein
MATTFNAIGTTFYGKRRFETDESFVTTKWFVIGFFPIIPLGSARVRHLETSGVPFIARTTSFEVLEELPTDGVQVIFTYIYAIFIVAWVAYFMTKEMSAVPKLVLIIGGILLTHLLRFFAKMRAS